MQEHKDSGRVHPIFSSNYSLGLFRYAVSMQKGFLKSTVWNSHNIVFFIAYHGLEIQRNLSRDGLFQLHDLYGLVKEILCSWE